MITAFGGECKLGLTEEALGVGAANAGRSNLFRLTEPVLTDVRRILMRFTSSPTLTVCQTSTPFFDGDYYINICFRQSPGTGRASLTLP